MVHVQTHLEPLERTLAASTADEGADVALTHAAERLVRERIGEAPKRVRLLSTDAGRVLFITIRVPAEESLTDAHQLAGELEEELRLQTPDIADVVIHTEP